MKLSLDVWAAGRLSTRHRGASKCGSTGSALSSAATVAEGTPEFSSTVSHVESLLSEARAQANEASESVWRHRHFRSLHTRRLMSPAIFVGAVGCLFREPLRCCLWGERGTCWRGECLQGAFLICRRWGAVQTRCLAETRCARNLAMRLKKVSTSRCGFSAVALPAPRGTDFGVSSTDSSTAASCARRSSNSHSEYKATSSGGCTVGEITDPAAMDLAYVPCVSHVWEAMMLIEKHTSLRHCAWFQRRHNCVRASPVLEFSLSKSASSSVCNKRFFKATICPSMMARIGTWFLNNSFVLRPDFIEVDG